MSIPVNVHLPVPPNPQPSNTGMKEEKGTSGYLRIRVKDYQLSALSDTKLLRPDMHIRGSYQYNDFTLSLPMDDPEFAGCVLQLCTYTKKVHFYQRVGIVVGSLVVIAVVWLLSL